MRKLDKKDIAQLRKLLDGAANIAITTHMSPDGDALGSSLALWHIISNMGKNATVIIPDPYPEQLSILSGHKEIVVFARHPEFAQSIIDDADLIFCLDFNALKRIDRLSDPIAAAKAPKVLIDHHLDPEPFAQITFSRPECSSTCLLLFKVACALELVGAIDRNAAECFLAGMLTDTGNLSYNSNDPEIYDTAARLIELGANHDFLSKKLFDTFSENCIRLNAYAIDKNLRVWPDHGAALITLTRDELNRFHYHKGYTEGLVNKPLAIPAVTYSAFFREEDEYVKVSMRSKGDFPCDIICSQHFNGGGHRNAAGGEFLGSLDEAVNKFESIIEENYKKYISKDIKL